jgi:hypothetical protein
MVEYVAGEDSYEKGWDSDTGKPWVVPGTFWEAIHRIKKRRDANDAAPMTPTETAAMFAAECQPFLHWSDNGNCDERTDYLN